MNLTGVQTRIFNAAAHLQQRMHGGAQAVTADAGAASGCPVQKVRRTLQNLGDGGETKRREVRDDLARVFGPVAQELHAGVRALADVPVERLVQAGADPVASRNHAPGPWRWFKLKVDVAAERSSMDKLSTHITSRQQIPGEEHIHGLDVVIPPSAYGTAMDNAIVGAARVMNAVALEQMRQPLAKVSGEHGALLEKWTFQQDALKALMEGIGTYAASTGLLARTQVPGMDGAQLLTALRDSSAYTKLAAAPLGIVGPMTFRGFAPKEAVVATAAGGVELSPQLQEIISSTRALRKEGVSTGPQARQTLQGCPILSPTAGKDAASGASMLKTLADDYLDLVQRFYAHEVSTASAPGRTS